MTILCDEDKHLTITKRSRIYKYETGVDEIKFLIPPIINDIDMSELKCVVLVSIDNEDEDKKGLFKYLSYEEELYKERLITKIPITTALTKHEGKINIWLLFLKANPENPKLASNIMQTNFTSFRIDVNDSKYLNNEEDFDEVWSHTSIEELASDVDKLTEEVKKKGDNLVLDEDERNVILLKSGEDVLCSVKLDDDVKWEEWE